MSKLSSQWVDIFAAGDHGAKGTFTEGDLDAIVANYRPDVHEAPAVIGHPKTNAPAFGWTESLRRQGKVLQAKFKQVVPAFEEAVDAGLFKKRSVSLYTRPGGYSLRHVGFLGAQPPEIKGLADIKFEDENKESVDIDFEESTVADVNHEAIAETVLSKFKKLFNIDEQTPSTKTFSEEQVTKIATDAAAAAATAAIAPLEARLKTQETQFSETRSSLATAATKARATDAITRLKRAGKWVPAFERTGLSVVFDELATADQVVEFGEGDKKKSVTPLDALVNFLEELPAIVPTAAVYAGQSVAGTGSDLPGVNDNGRAPADPNSVALDAAIKNYMAEKNVTDYGAAMKAVAAAKPELTKSGGATAGTV